MDMVCVILAGGQGKRMASADRHKVCFPIAGRPAIVRAIDTYKAAGLRHFVVVVGQMAQEVMDTVAAAHPEVTFVFQAEPRGTGHAAAIAAEALAAQNHRGAALIVMGDKVTRPAVVRNLIEQFAPPPDARGQTAGGRPRLDKDLKSPERRGTGSQPPAALWTPSDLVVTTLPKRPHSTAGRVVTDRRGNVLGVVEFKDIHHAREKGTTLPVGGRRLTPDEIENASPSVNASMYVFRFEALREALEQLRSDNAQGELYLTDTVGHLARRGRVRAMLVSDPTDLMAFNTPAELLAIEEVVRGRERPPRVRPAGKTPTPRTLKPAREWLRILREGGSELRRLLGDIYGSDESLHEERRGAMVGLAAAFARRMGGERPMILCRAPGRVNLMGRHVDHRGGFVNVMAISREVLLAAAPRGDDLVTLRNVEARRFPPREFRIGDLLGQQTWSDWMDFLSSRAVQGVLESSRGDWSHYARAALLRLQHECRTVRLRGMDCVVSGSIPVGAGLSSSSAMVVAFAEAAVALNALDVAIRDFVDLCGEGEWFVGSRGGSADHAAIRTSRAGCISRIAFFPFRLAGEVPFPPDLRLVIAHSGETAVKSRGAREVFNQRVACYELAEMLLRRNWPPAASAEHLRDLTPAALKLRGGGIYRALACLPPRPTRTQLRRLLKDEDPGRLERLFAAHHDLGPYDLRGVALFGLSECVRSERFAQKMARGDLKCVGRFMRTSHDGDRMVRFDVCHPQGSSSCRAGRHGKPPRHHKHLVRTDDEALLALAAADADLADQCGRYACSTEAIDLLVDIANTVQGVIGAQLAGAGLGGCMMILVRSRSVQALLKELRQGFYQPRNLPFAAHVCTPVAGAGLLSL